MSRDIYTCELCVEDINDNIRIICPHCNVEICEPCFQYGLLLENQDPKCIYCKKLLSLEFVLSNNDTKWLKNNFIEYYSNLLFEKEKNKLMDTVPKYKLFLQIQDIKNDFKIFKIDNTNKKIIEKIKRNIENNDDFELLYDKLIDERNKKKENFSIIINELEKKLTIKMKKDIEKKKSFIKKCPNDKCKGFINIEYQCELCDVEICKTCYEMIQEDHICNINNIECAELIKKDSKPCPNCYVPIFKISGCNQMFCTNCNCTFSWETLEIDKGVVHNPHYFDYIAKLRTLDQNVVLENIACGDIEQVYMTTFKYTHNTWIHDIYVINREIFSEIIPFIENKCKDNFEYYRLQYLKDNITEKSWKKKIMNDVLFNNAIQNYIEIMRLFVTLTSDMLYSICYNIYEKNKKMNIEAKKKLKYFINQEIYETQFRQIKTYFLLNLDKIYDIFGIDLHSDNIMRIIFFLEKHNFYYSNYYIY